MADDWLESLRCLTVADVAPLCGLRVAPNPTLGGAGPCPSCGAVARGSTDKRGPLRLSRDLRMWHCKRCDAGGDAVSLVAHVSGAVAAGGGGGVDYRRVAEWSRARGLVESRPLAPPSGAVPARAPARVPPSGAAPAPVPAPTYPNRREVDAVWAACVPLYESPAVLRWLSDVRGYSGECIERLCDRDVARVVPDGARLPDWAARADGRVLRGWGELGYLCVLPLYDARGDMRALLARCVFPGVTPKSLGARGYERVGLVMADGLALRLLRAGVWPDDISGGVGVGVYGPQTVLLVEGEMDYLAAVSSYADREGADYPAVIGAVQGSLTADVLARVPDGTTIAYAAHCDAAGVLDRGAVALARAVRDGCGVRLRDGRLLLCLVGAAAAARVNGGV